MSENDPIQIATPEWFKGCMDASKALHAENGQHPYSLEKCAAVIWRGLTRQLSIIGAVGSPELVKGMIILEINGVYYSDETQIEEKLNFVRPEFRRSTYARDLIRFAKRFSDDIGLELFIGIVSDKDLERKEKLYARELMKAGTWFKHVPCKTEALIAAE